MRHVTALMLCATVYTMPICFNRQSRAAEYEFAEIVVLPWGDGTNELKIQLPSYSDVNNTPEDPSDDFLEDPGAGPDQGFVDRFENVYFSSYGLAYLKGFDNSGRLFVDFSGGQLNGDTGIFRGTVDKFYVDSQTRIYILGFPPTNYVAVVDTAGNLLDKLNPKGLDSQVNICAMFFNSNDLITLVCCNKEMYLYDKGDFTPGSSVGWRTSNGDYYGATASDSSHIRFVSSRNPGLDGRSPSLNEHFVPLESHVLTAGLLGADDDMGLYVYALQRHKRMLVQQYDTEFNLHAEIILLSGENKYRRYLRPFVRADGTIYEFRCLDDGLHVIRWSDE